MNALLIFIGGGLGSLARYGTGKFFASVSASGFPVGTLASNIISSLILGVFIGWIAMKPGHDHPMRFLIAIGFCGGFSTFSTFSAETFELIRNGMIMFAAANILLNLIICVGCIAAGIWMCRWWGASF